MKNQEVSKLLYDIAELLEMKQEQWKPQAYRKVARSVEELNEDIDQIYAREGIEGLRKIKGVGEAISEKLDEYLSTGKLIYFEELKSKFPRHIGMLSAVPGLGPKKIKFLSEQLNISTIEDLEKAAKEKKISKLKGFGERTERDILRGIDIVRAGQKRMLLGKAMKIADFLKAKLGGLDFVDKITVAGSFRRRQETVGDLDILICSKKPEKVMDFFTSMQDVQRILAKGPTKSSVLIVGGLQVDLRVVEEKSYGAALQYFSGNTAHNVRLREIAIKKGLKLNEYGLFDKNQKLVAGKNEHEVYEKLGLSYIEPELRSDSGEIEAASKNSLPQLIPYGTIKGNFHTHTHRSDGADSLKAMVDECVKLGYEYVGITDHSVSERIAGGLPERDMERWLLEIKDFAKKEKRIKVFAGSEVSIKSDGTLDYSDELLNKMDIIVASVHSGFKSSKDVMTPRIIKALNSGHVDILGHPTGRLIGRREPYEVDIKAVIQAAIDNKVLLEINAQHDRMDLKDSYVRLAKGMGAKFCVNTDAHSTAELHNMDLGVSIARRGWLEKCDVANAASLKDLPKFFRKIKS